MGEDSESEETWENTENRQTGSGIAVPLTQAAICILALLALMMIKLAAPKKYETLTDWYRKEAAREIQLPSWEGHAPEKDVSGGSSLTSQS